MERCEYPPVGSVTGTTAQSASLLVGAFATELPVIERLRSAIEKSEGDGCCQLVETTRFIAAFLGERLQIQSWSQDGEGKKYSFKQMQHEPKVVVARRLCRGKPWLSFSSRKLCCCCSFAPTPLRHKFWNTQTKLSSTISCL